MMWRYLQNEVNLQYQDTWLQTLVQAHQQVHIATGSDTLPRIYPIEGFESASLSRQWYRCHLDVSTMLPAEESLERLSFVQQQQIGTLEMLSRPCMLQGMTDNWPAAGWTAAGLLKSNGHTNFAVSKSTGGTGFMDLANYLKYCAQQHDEDPLYIFDAAFGEKSPALLDYTVPCAFSEDLHACIGSERPDFRWLVIGPARSGSGWHQDPRATSAWNALLSGRKRWALLPPDSRPPMTHLTSLQWFLEVYPTLPADFGLIEAVQRPGETIHVPGGWWHIVLNLDQLSIAVTQNFVPLHRLEAAMIDAAEDGGPDPFASSSLLGRWLRAGVRQYHLVSIRAVKTDDEHPCGEGKLEWPFNAKAFYVGKEIKHRVKELLDSAKELGFPRALSKENPLLCLSPMAQLSEKAVGATGLPCASYIIAFERMESVVFINGEGKEKQIWQKLTGGQLTAKYTEEYRVSVMPDLNDGDVHAADCLVLERAEFNNIRTLAYVLAQTVALHFYETQVDRTLRKFEDMNMEMEGSGSFRPAMRKEELLQMVARNNLLFTAIISKLAVMERFDLAWKNPDCNKVYEHLLEELEIEDRYENLQLKLNMVQDNFRYFLELIQNQKSDLLEWIIIILIGGEISLNLYELFMK
ncbi:hypothetical protein WJX73_010262 [Symbiochloris irregularis]|uniref:JmjC domain-containing protein n=1 Tax=Symbiochloris irregularis TaxID=706552 RepID=A0AAW1PQH8_9CHLO